jgi:hypothetical protein
MRHGLTRIICFDVMLFAIPDLLYVVYVCLLVIDFNLLVKTLFDKISGRAREQRNYE